MIGGGGNFMYISAFHFANIFPESRRAVPIGLLGGMFNFSGSVFMLLNVKGVTIRSFFQAYTWIGLGLTLIVFAVFPDRAYLPGQSAALAMPTCRHVDFKTLCRDLSRNDLWAALRSPRFVAFALLFSVSATTNVVVGGLIPPLTASKG